MEENRSGDVPTGLDIPPPNSQSPSAHVSPLMAEAGEVFRRELPQLLKERRGQWVAYHGSERIGFAATKPEMYQVCLARGLDLYETYVDCIEPTDVYVFGPGALWDLAFGPAYPPGALAPPRIREAEATFRRDLPQLLKERPGYWVAYYGSQQIGFAPTKPEMDQICRDRGLDLYETLMECIEPPGGDFFRGLGPIDDVPSEQE